jgi:hypothetical protein
MFASRTARPYASSLFAKKTGKIRAANHGRGQPLEGKLRSDLGCQHRRLEPAGKFDCLLRGYGAGGSARGS